MASTTSSAFPLATLDPCTSDCTDSPGTANSDGSISNNAGAGSGNDNTFSLSKGGIIALIVVFVFFAIMGIGTATLFYLAKKKEWKIKETIRRSAKRVVIALTPRRTEFPSSVKHGSVKSRRGHVRMDDVPPTPRLKIEDVERGPKLTRDWKKFSSKV
ncbi:hypothetical protein BD289DRAFT_480111 [Coniella lustricola]|uniref:Uncharacterized protein n=1 Tax=Coniella lustricola TaxID=2025994 RepID=A0A2T3AGS9_9PEZI|nr:hypothetical protein BD289DRAFT_480111 [Coniella lustricola]